MIQAGMKMKLWKFEVIYTACWRWISNRDDPVWIQSGMIQSFHIICWIEVVLFSVLLFAYNFQECIPKQCVCVLISEDLSAHYYALHGCIIVWTLFEPGCVSMRWTCSSLIEPFHPSFVNSSTYQRTPHTSKNCWEAMRVPPNKKTARYQK